MDEYQNWKDMVYKAIVSIADIEFQKRAWLGNSQEVSSFVETISTLFDDAFFVRFLENEVWDNLNLSHELHEEMRALQTMIEEYNEPESERAILSDSKWIDIVQQARKVIQSFDIERS